MSFHHLLKILIKSRSFWKRGKEMKKKRVFISLIVVMLICISSLAAEASFYVASINPEIGTLMSERGTAKDGLAIQTTVSRRYQPFVIVINNMDKKVSDFDSRMLRGSNSVFIINAGRLEAFWHQNVQVKLEKNTIYYGDRSNLQVEVDDIEDDFYTLKITENGSVSNLSFEPISENKPRLSRNNGSYNIGIPRNYREPIRIYVDGPEINLAR